MDYTPMSHSSIVFENLFIFSNFFFKKTLRLYHFLFISEMSTSMLCTFEGHIFAEYPSFLK